MVLVLVELALGWSMQKPTIAAFVTRHKRNEKIHRHIDAWEKRRSEINKAHQELIKESYPKLWSCHPDFVRAHYKSNTLEGSCETRPTKKHFIKAIRGNLGRIIAHKISHIEWIEPYCEKTSFTDAMRLMAYSVRHGCW